MKAWSRTYSGELIDLLDPKPEQIHIEDIAHHLSMLCRFSGATKRFYSVAEHSINVADLMVKLGLSGLDGLLHDASEAYLNDINGNLKKMLPDYKAVETRFEAVIREKFKIQPLDKSGKNCDLIMLNIEGKRLIRGWQGNHSIKTDIELNCLNPTRAKIKFLEEFEKHYKISINQEKIILTT